MHTALCVAPEISGFDDSWHEFLYRGEGIKADKPLTRCEGCVGVVPGPERVVAGLEGLALELVEFEFT